jgi:hypothetical protein
MDTAGNEGVSWNPVPGLVSNGLAWRLVMVMHSAFVAAFQLLEKELEELQSCVQTPAIRNMELPCHSLNQTSGLCR